MRRLLASGRAFSWFAAVLLLAAGALAYRGALEAGWVFDDRATVADNPSIRQLWPPAVPLWPPPQAATGGRPVANLTFALNFAAGGEAPRGYHAVNVLLHCAAAWLLFLVVRRTLRASGRREFSATRGDGEGAALAVAAVWLLHPVLTGAVSYVAQRTEVLVGVFYLLALYAFIRATEAETLSRARAWGGFTVVTCALGMATKEVMVTAPVMLALYDRAFLAGSWREGWRRRGRLHLAIAATWLLLGALMIASQVGERGVGFTHRLSSWEYALTSARSVLRYLGLAAWPQPLVFDYGWDFVSTLARGWGWLLACAALVAAALALWRRRPRLGFLAAWFFVTLAPTTSVVPVTEQPMAENRLYLPLAALVVAGVFAAWRAIGARRAWFAIAGAALAFGLQTHRRQAVYRDEITIWTETLVKRPDNARAHANLGTALLDAGQPARAREHFAAALRLMPAYPQAAYGLGSALLDDGHAEEALPHFARAVALQPNYPKAENNWANALLRLGRAEEAAPHYRRALVQRPEMFEANFNLAVLESQRGRWAEALAQLEIARRLRPDFAPTQRTIGDGLRALGRPAEALAAYAEALRLRPDFAEAHWGLGAAQAALGRPTEALASLERAVALSPGLLEAREQLAAVFTQLGRAADARAQIETVQRLRRDAAVAHYAEGNAHALAGRTAEARRSYEAVLQLEPGAVEARNNLGVLLLRGGDAAAARAQFAEALRLKPDYADAARNLDEATAILEGGVPRR